MIIQANHHAGYYPGIQPMVPQAPLRAGHRQGPGAVQAGGGEGVDKRVDVISTLTHFGGTVRDLAKLDLAYAPPFGSAKDPLHMAAFAAENHLDGLAPVVQPDIASVRTRRVDVRSAAEVEALPLADCDLIINIPLDQLRDRLGELDPVAADGRGLPLRACAPTWARASSSSTASTRSTTSRAPRPCVSSR